MIAKVQIYQKIKRDLVVKKDNKIESNGKKKERDQGDRGKMK